VSYGIEIYDEDGEVTLTSEASNLLFVDSILHSGDAGAVFEYPDLAGRQVFIQAVPYQGFAFFSISYPSGVPRITTLEPEWGTGLSQVRAFVFAL